MLEKMEEGKKEPFKPGWQIAQGNRSHTTCFGHHERAESESDFARVAEIVAAANARDFPDHCRSGEYPCFWATYFQQEGDGGVRTVEVKPRSREWNR